MSPRRRGHVPQDRPGPAQGVVGMRLESGPATGDRNYFALVTLLCLGLCVYFLYDWRIGYPKANHDAALGWLSAKLGSPAAAAQKWATLTDKPAEAEAGALRTRIAQHTGSSAPRALAREVLDVAPLLSSPPLDGETNDYYVSRYGVITVPSRNNIIARADRVDWTPWKKTHKQIEDQFYWSLLPLVLGLYFGYRLYRAVSLHATLDDEALTYGGQRVPYAAMTDLRDFNKKGWIDLYYQDGRRERKLRLDRIKIAKFSELVALLCAEKGFRNLVQEHVDEQARAREADDADEPDEIDAPEPDESVAPGASADPGEDDVPAEPKT
jgi:hypothetical protein